MSLSQSLYSQPHVIQRVKLKMTYIVHDQSTIEYITSISMSLQSDRKYISQCASYYHSPRAVL